MQRFEIEKLVGLDLSSVEGVSQTSPVVLKGVGFDRRGGYEQSGSVQSGIANETVGDPDDLLGYDQGGFAGRVFTNITGDVYKLIDNGTVTSSTSTGSGEGYCFVGKVGIFGAAADNDTIVGGTTRDAFFFVAVQDGSFINGSDVVTSGNPVEITSASATTVSTGGVTTTVDTYLGFAAAPWLNTEAGKLIAGWASSPMFEHSDSARFEYNYAVSQSSANASASVDVFFIDRARGQYTHIEQSDTVNTSGTVETYPFGLTYSFPVAAAYSGHAVLHNRRVYGVPSSDINRYSSPRETDETANLLASLGNSAVIYSSFGYVNLVENDSWFKVPFNTSSGVTALASSPGGLLIFGDRETFLARSDPALGDFQVQRLSGLTGHDSDFPPAVIGGTVFCVSDGEVYAVSLGMGDVDFGATIQEISQPFSGEVSFERVTANAGNRAIVASYLVDGGVGDRAYRAYRFDLDDQQWVNDPLDDTSLSGADPFPLPSASGDGYYLHPESGSLDFLRPYGGGSATPMEVKWEDVDLGDKNLKKMWRRVRVYTNDGYSGTPELDWSISGSSGTISASGQGGNRFVFTLPSGKVGEKADLTVRMVGAASGDTLEPPVVIEAAPRYRQR